MAKQPENKSLFLYTALIFFAAIIIIIVAFFGQANLERSQPSLPDITSAPIEEGITQKASRLSEQNALLVTQNETLKTLNDELSSDVDALEARNAELEINNTTGNILCSIYQYIYDKNYDDAQVVLNSINVDSLTDAQKIIYNNLTKILKTK